MDRFTTDVVFLGLLSVVAQITSALLVVGVTVSIFNPRLKTALNSKLSEFGILLAAMVSFSMMVGSLYLSEVKGYPPCRLCWFQRAAAYPIWVVLAISIALKADWLRRFVALPLALIGVAISSYHVLLEKYPERFETATTCSIDNPCSARWIDGLLGYLTIPRMALSGFVLMTLLLVFTPRPKPSQQELTVDLVD